MYHLQKVGINCQVTESVPAVFGIIAGTEEYFWESLSASVNVDGNTDTITAMTCVILGSYHDNNIIPPELITKMKTAHPTLSMETVINQFIEGLDELR